MPLLLACNIIMYFLAPVIYNNASRLEWRQVWLVADTSVDVNCGNFDDLKEMQYY